MTYFNAPLFDYCDLKFCSATCGNQFSFYAACSCTQLQMSRFSYCHTLSTYFRKWRQNGNRITYLVCGSCLMAVWRSTSAIYIYTEIDSWFLRKAWQWQSYDFALANFTSSQSYSLFLFPLDPNQPSRQPHSNPNPRSYGRRNKSNTIIL